MPAPLLALDTSGPTARVAIVARDGRLLATAERTAERHSHALLSLCDEALGAAGARVADLAGIACGAGPGSFTGLRVGLAVVKGLALPFDLPLLLISSLEALALDLGRTDEEATLAPCIDAGKGEVYGQLFRMVGGAPRAIGAEQRLSPAAYAGLLLEAGDFVLGGVGLDRHTTTFASLLPASSLRQRLPGPSAGAIATLALSRLARGERDDLAAAVPSYGRPPDITTPKRRPIP
jgi:tRNA threonylcarbamoyladenosine biosynthesis protein TsaB